jgi:hypothetical protein
VIGVVDGGAGGAATGEPGTAEHRRSRCSPSHPEGLERMRRGSARQIAYFSAVVFVSASVFRERDYIRQRMIAHQRPPRPLRSAGCPILLLRRLFWLLNTAQMKHWRSLAARRSVPGRFDADPSSSRSTATSTSSVQWLAMFRRSIAAVGRTRHLHGTSCPSRHRRTSPKCP